MDVFTVPAAGGVPKRLTFHPDADRVVGWTPDGTRILFRSNRLSHPRTTQLYTVTAEGGLPEVLPLPMACMGAYSPDGKRMLYAPLDGGQFAPGFTNFVAWKRYRGGTASYLWIVNFADLATVKVPRTDSNDIYPMWIGDKTYFLSDRNGPMTLFSYDPQTRKVTELIRNTGKDIMSASAGPGGIVYEQFGQIHIYDIASGKEHAVNIEIDADLTEVRPRFQNVSRELRNAAHLSHRHASRVRSPRRDADGPRREGRGPQPDQHPRRDGAGPGMVAGRQERSLISPMNPASTPCTSSRRTAGARRRRFHWPATRPSISNPKWSPDSKPSRSTTTWTTCGWWMSLAASPTKVDTDYLYDLNRDV